VPKARNKVRPNVSAKAAKNSQHYSARGTAIGRREDFSVKSFGGGRPGGRVQRRGTGLLNLWVTTALSDKSRRSNKRKIVAQMDYVTCRKDAGQVDDGDMGGRITRNNKLVCKREPETGKQVSLLVKVIKVNGIHRG